MLPIWETRKSREEEKCLFIFIVTKKKERKKRDDTRRAFASSSVIFILGDKYHFIQFTSLSFRHVKAVRCANSCDPLRVVLAD